MPAKSVRNRSFVKDAKAASAGLLLGYARVSRGDDQNNAMQTKALKAAGCRRLFEETEPPRVYRRAKLSEDCLYGAEKDLKALFTGVS